MSTLDDLVALVELHPTNPILTGMLYDHLYGDVGMTHSEAEARVATVVATARDAQRIRQACALLASDYSRRGHVLRMIYQHCGVPVGYYPTVIVISGDQTYVMSADPGVPPDPYWGRASIAAGATWLLERWDEYARTLPEWRGHRRRPRRPR
jgi:hypothetical protein